MTSLCLVSGALYGRPVLAAASLEFTGKILYDLSKRILQFQRKHLEHSMRPQPENVGYVAQNAEKIETQKSALLGVK